MRIVSVKRLLKNVASHLRRANSKRLGSLVTAINCIQTPITDKIKDYAFERTVHSRSYSV
jgi:hypothetical protein